MIPLTITPARLFALAFVVSAGLNAWQFNSNNSLRVELGKAQASAETVATVAQACSESVEKIATKATEQAVAARTAVGEAQARAKAAEARARAELTRQQAVPGDACASAQVENREWLLKRKVAP